MLGNSKVAILILSVVLASCNQANKDSERPLIYEGMSSKDLVEVLGRPASIDSSSKVFNAEIRVMQNLEKWYFPNRTVLIINDTVKDPSL